MPKILINIPDHMQTLLEQASKEQNQTMAAIARAAIAEYLSRLYNTDVPHNMQWGGDRKSKREVDSEE